MGMLYTDRNAYFLAIHSVGSQTFKMVRFAFTYEMEYN
jgi:hypothetical protein